MSFLFCPFYKFIFKDELKKTIISKINEIQTSSSWRDFDLGLTASEIKSSDLRYEDVCKHLEIWEDLAKLSVDLWRDFYYYGRFTFEGRFADREYTRRLEDLGCECVDGRWRSVRRPQEESVQTNVFMWRLYELLAEQIEGPPGKCPFCRVALTTANGPCGSCDASSEDILNQKIVDGRARQAEKRPDGGTVSFGLACDIRRATFDHDTQTEHTITNVGVQCFIMYADTESQTEFEEDARKCDPCGEENKYARRINDSLGEKEHLKIDNFGNNHTRMERGLEDKFEEGERSKAINDKMGTEVKNVEVGKWRCGKCELINEYEYANCTACGTLSNEGLWTCEHCTMLNSLDKEGCGACGKENKYAQAAGARGGQHGLDNNILGSCPRCSLRYDACSVRVDCGSKNSVKYQTCKWKCLYVKCGEMNNDDCQYCRKCQLDRFHSQKRGESVRVGRDCDYTRNIWICIKCAMFNDLEYPVCTKCEEKRYKKRFCPRCQVYNEGSSINCDKCENRLA